MRLLCMLLLSLAILVFSGCNGGDSFSNQKDSDNNPGKITPDTSNQTFDTNKTFDNSKYTPKSATIQMGSAYVNKYNDIQNTLLSQKANQSDFNLTIDMYVDELLYVHKPVDKIPSYAPRGELRSKIFDVKNGGIDYSSYILEGDFNNDGLIDFKDIDLLKEELYKNVNSSTFDEKYDLDKDGKLDTKDLLTLTSRLLTNISYFDFYDVNGKKLDIATKEYSDPKNISYNESETKIMVVAKDMNKASSYTDTLSDINSVWYKQSTTKSRGYFNDKKEFGDRQAAINYVNKNLQKYVDISPAYVTGFRYNARLFSSIDGMDFIDFSTSSGTIESIAKDIENHFPTKLGFKYKKSITPKQVIFHIGNLEDKKHTGVNALRGTLKTTTKVGNETITKLVSLHVGSVTFYSTNETIKANVKDTSGNGAKGTLSLNRYGPLPKEQTFTKEATGDFIFTDGAFGGYTFSFANECGCEVPLEPSKKDIVVDSDKNLNLQITKMQKDISVKLTYKDSEGKPIKNKKVTVSETSKCRSKGHVPGTMVKTTDDNGVVSFTNNFTSGEFMIDGTSYNFCEDTDKSMSGENLWDISYDFRGRITNFKKTYTNVKIHGADEPTHPAPQIGDSTNTVDNVELPFTVTSSMEGYSLTVTKLGMSSDWQFNMDYYPQGINVQNMLNIPSDTYCFRTDDLDEAMSPSETVSDNTPVGCSEPLKICFNLYNPSTGELIGEDCASSYPSDYNGIVTTLSTEQKKKLKNHESFTFSDWGYWYYNQNFGKSYLTVEFTAK